MGGSYRHVTNSDGSFRGFDLLDGRRDDGMAIKEMWQMIDHLAKRISDSTGADPRRVIHEAWRWGVERPPENTNNESICGFDAFWSDD